MEHPLKIIIALGSNQGDKFKNLQLAIDEIHNQVGVIDKISKVYQSKAVGFEGDDFLNACIQVQTHLKPKTVMRQLLSIEKALGRARRTTEGHENRTIDLDIIFINDQVIDAKTLLVPHPEMHNRLFVLKPLHDISPRYIHPKLNKDVVELLETTKDQSKMESLKIWLKNPSKSYDFSKHNYIAIEGNIGAGKTSLATMMSREFNAKLILERFADNPFLPKFYEEPQRYAFTLEMSFLADRYQQISDDLSQLDLFKDFIISDYDVFKSLIFSKITLPEDEFILYRKLFYQVYKDIAKPDLYVYLYQNTKRLQENIKKRGRNYEKNIENEYLEKINSGYLEFLRNQTELNVKIIDISDKDFVENRSDYLDILNTISD
ncbi:MAG: 2-amino-4-hydroxy-6-hydroxymethyldihydropteridine diphosphokinase [Flavobacteriaceae bacterium]|nr:2-amino-4-hydroxy-6-hydroxymethyldihydropteridine diphosphokinase [Flavobacteriaceae bacterium]